MMMTTLEKMFQVVIYYSSFLIERFLQGNNNLPIMDLDKMVNLKDNH